jgi:hypothetical protein
VISQVSLADFLSSVVAPSVAIIATLVGLVVALSQLTAGARLSKQAEYWKQEYLEADLSQDKQVYQSMHRLAVGKIVARNGVPLRRIIVAACALIPAVFLLAGGTQRLVFQPGLDGWILFAIGVLGGLIGFFIALGEYSVLNFARRDVLVSFLDGNRIISDFSVWPDRRRAFRVLGRRGVVEVLIVSISACAVVVAATVSVVALSTEDAAVPDWVTPITYLAYPSVIYLLFAIAGSSNLKRTEVWIHPRPLTAAAGVATDRSSMRADKEVPLTDQVN